MKPKGRSWVHRIPIDLSSFIYVQTIATGIVVRNPMAETLPYNDWVDMQLCRWIVVALSRTCDMAVQLKYEM